MGLTRSLSAGASSLRAHQRRMDVISNNIANTNTIGYKANRAQFADQLSQTMTHGKGPDPETGSGSGGVNPLQFGLGVKLGSVVKDMSQGIIETTNRPLDMAIQGDGFFVYNLNNREFYSRAGAISHDKGGFLVDGNSGAYLQGYNVDVDANGKALKDANGANVLKRDIENLKISANTISLPRQTENVVVSGNMNVDAAVGDSRSTSITVFDDLGGSRTLTLTFTKDATANQYTIAGEIEGAALTLGTSTLTFNADGTVNTPTDIAITAADLNAAIGSTVFDETAPKDLNIQLAESGNLQNSLTQFAGASTVTATEQDGYQSGELLGMSVDSQGKIWGAFTNGASEALGQVIITKFDNPAGLTKAGGNFLAVSPNSGLPNYGAAGEIFASSSIAGGSLEQSNVDLTTEFTDMIATQRAFEAASRTITVSDQLLGETNILKR